MLYLFECYALDTDRRQLRCEGHLVPLEPQVFDLLNYLIENRARVVSKGDLLASVWEGRSVSESTLTSRINAARRAVRDSGAEQRLIQTLPRKGIRFVGAVQEPSRSATADSRPPLELPGRPYVAVLPFQNLSVDPEQEYVADGIVEEIITALSRFPSLFVAARSSSFTYKGRMADVRQVGRELGVRYVLEGSVRKAGNRVRITSQLVQAETGNHVWADRYERELGDIFALQDEISANIVGALVPSVERAEVQRACRKPPKDPDTYGLYLRAMAALSPWTREGTDEALQLLEQALALDPNSVDAILLAESCWGRRFVQGWSPPAEALQESGRLARLAVQIEPENAEAIAVLAHRTPAINHRYEEAISLAEQAVTINPSSAFAWGQSGWGLVYAGCPKPALLHFQRTLRLNPRDPRARNYLSGMVLALIQLERDRDAVAIGRKAVQHCPNGAGPLCVLTASLALTGQLDEARVALRNLLELDPTCTVTSVLRFGYSEKARRRYFEGLRKAGMPE